MKDRLRWLFHSSSAGTEEANREVSTKAVLAATGAILVVLSAISIVFWLLAIMSLRDLIIVASCDLLVAALFLIALRGGWRIVAYVLPIIFLLLASFLSYSRGIFSPAIVFFCVPIVAASTLLRGRADLVMLGLSLFLYGLASYTHGDRDLGQLAVVLLSVAAPLVGTTALLRFSRRRLQEEVRDRRGAELAARESAEKVRAIFESIEDGIVVTDLQGRVIEANESALRMLGISSRENFIGTYSISFVAEADRPRCVETLQGVVEGTVSGLTHYRLHRSDGSELAVQSTTALLKDSAGRPIAVVAVTRDITRQLELELQLRQAQKMEAIGQLAGGVAHYFNNLLMAIRGYTELAIQGLGFAHPAHENLSEVSKAAERARALVQQLLSFSRKEGVKLQPLDLNKVVSGLEEMLARIIGEQAILDIVPAPDLQQVLADQRQIEQVIVNLCINARDAMPGGGHITLETANAHFDRSFVEANAWAHEGEWVRLNVTDTGVGIPPEVLEHIFEPFFTTRGVGRGTGLGLAAVYGIIKAHDGLLHCDSQPGRGTTFSFLLPSRMVEAAEGAESLAAKRHSKPGETILLAEDEEKVRNLALKLLQEAGYRVIPAENGEEAVRLFATHAEEVNLAVLDSVMPGMNGKDTAERIRALRPDLPILFVSGYDFSTEGSFLTGNGGVALLRKPYRAQQLLQSVREAMEGRSGKR